MVKTGRPQSSPTEIKDAHVPGMIRFSKTGLSLLVVAVFVLGLFSGSFLVRTNKIPAEDQSHLQANPMDSAQQKNTNTDPSIEGHIAELEKIVLEHPKDRDSLVHLGNLYFDTGQADKAQKTYEAALALQGNDPDVLTDLGVMYREQKKYEKAVSSFQKALSYNDAHAGALFNKGIVLIFDLGKLDEGRKTWETLLSLHPKATGPDGTPVAELLKNLPTSSNN